MPPIAILRFSRTEGPAYFAEWLDAHRLSWQLVALDAGDAVPADPRAFAGIGMMGGPMSVNDALPWIEPACRLLRDAVDARVPVIGHCLGGQLLAKALGARVTRAAQSEIGWIDVEVVGADGAPATDAARTTDATPATAQAAAPDAAQAPDWFGGRRRFTVFQWHYDAFEPPRGATRVLANAFNPNQAYVVDDLHIGMQCHVEMTEDLVDTWCRSGGSELPAQSGEAVHSEADIRRDLAARVGALHAVASSIYTRWTRGLVTR